MDLKVGIEVHQQLSTKTKLFCECPGYVESKAAIDSKVKGASEIFPIMFTRKLRPVASELGEVDVAARFESRREIVVKYFASPDSSCLVEADEEPPHPLNQDALDTSLLFALALKSRVIDEIHVMRKIVVDGSNTSGFQRTALVAVDGQLDYNSGKSVGVQSICLEEDAARTLNLKNSQARSYALDRLGTPLVEVALAPIIVGNPEDVSNAASALGHLLRSTGRVARGLGTIRQDLNVSIMSGKVVEVKGVQQLDLISKVVRYEALRQKLLIDLASEIKSKIGEKLETKIYDLTSVLSDTGSKVISSLLNDKKNKNILLCISIKNFAGFIGSENSLHARLGKEFGAIARVYGLGGVFHSDELPNYGITQTDMDSVRNHTGASESDAFILIAGDEKKVRDCSDALVKRIEYTPKGVPDETRAATEDGETRFLRPRPGSARMYPETDIPLEIITPDRLERLKRQIPEPWNTQIQNFGEKFGLPLQLAEPLFDSDQRVVFEKVVKESKNLSPPLVASILIDTMQMLEREGVQIQNISQEKVTGMFRLVDQGKFAKEAVGEVLKYLSNNPNASSEQAVEKLGLYNMDNKEVERIVKKVISESGDILQAKGIGAQAAIMGKVMQVVRGKADGKIVSMIVENILKEKLTDMGRI